MTTGHDRRLRVVPPLPGQLSLHLPGIPTLEQIAELTATRTTRRRATPADGPGEVERPRRLLPTRDVDDTSPAVAARVPVEVWAVWDGEDLVGVYADETTARTDAAVLQRDATRAGQRGQTIDCLPLQMFTAPQHGTRHGPRMGLDQPRRR